MKPVDKREAGIYNDGEIVYGIINVNNGGDVVDDDEQWLQVRTRFISDLGHFFETYSGSEIMGWIMGLLFFTMEPLPLPEIAHALKISKAAASINIRTLRQIGMVEKVSFPGDRRDFYLVHRDFEQGMLSSTIKEIQDSLFIWDKTLAAVNRLDKKKMEFVSHRLASLQRLYTDFKRTIEELCRQNANRES